MRTAVTPRLLPVLLLLLGGCAAPQYRQIQDDRDDLPARAEVESVPFYPQDEYYCGPAALAMSLSWAGIPATEEDIAGQIYTPGRKGTLPTDILAGARRNGALAVRVASLHALLAELAAGHPVLVFQNLGLDFLPQWHFAVATGYDLDQGIIVLHSGRQPRRVTALKTFEHTWQRADYWAVTVTPPSQLPVQAGRRRILEAAAGLERAGNYAAAAAAYSAVADHWQDSVTARIGQGNAYYAAGDYGLSAAAFREALDRDPGNAPAWNNLAYALAGQGRHREALQAAQRALVIGGENAENYRQTLEEIREGMTQR